MKKIIKEASIYIIIAVTIWAIVAIVSPSKGVLVGKVAYDTFTKAIEIIIAVLIIIGFIQVWIPTQTLSKFLGKEAGWRGLILASTVPLFIGGSAFVIFPLLKALLDKGASIAFVIVFITAWSGKAPLLPLEIEFLGWKFALLRFALIVPFAILMGLISRVLLEKPKSSDTGGKGALM